MWSSSAIRSVADCRRVRSRSRGGGGGRKNEKEKKELDAERHRDPSERADGSVTGFLPRTSGGGAAAKEAALVRPRFREEATEANRDLRDCVRISLSRLVGNFSADSGATSVLIKKKTSKVTEPDIYVLLFGDCFVFLERPICSEPTLSER